MRASDLPPPPLLLPLRLQPPPGGKCSHFSLLLLWRQLLPLPGLCAAAAGGG
eukprot:COSAG06_NODE_70614_length_191_cov_20.478261_1_plen_51_part_01